MRSIELVVITVVVLALALLIAVAYENIIPSTAVRKVAEFYLYAAYNPFDLREYTAMSPEAVTSIVWDFRGLDTLFETAVFFLALIAGMALARGLYRETPQFKSEGLSLIVKSVTKITAPVIIAVGVSIGLHGHLTPGGGFQGGSVIAVAPMIFIVIFSVYFVLERGVAPSKMLVLRSLGLAGIGLTSVVLFMIALLRGSFAYVFQNMIKPGAPISMPAEISGALISGTLWFFNFFEMLAVAAGFSMAFIVVVLMRFGKGE